MCSALCQVWSDTELLFSSKDIDNSTLSEAEYRRMEVKMTECLGLGEVDEYNKPHRPLSVWLLANYRRKTFKAHDLKNIRAFTDSPGDPLVRCDKAGFAAAKQVADPVYRYDPELNEYKKVDEDPDIQDYKQYNRRHLLYCVGESAACNFAMGGTADKPIWSNKTTEKLRTLVIRFGLDPPASRRMLLPDLMHHEYTLRQKILTGLGSGTWSTWDEALDSADIKQYIAMEFRLRTPPPPKPQETRGTKGPGKGASHRYTPYTPTKESKPHKGAGKGDGVTKDGGGAGHGDPNIRGNYLMRDTETGKGFCIPWENGQPCKCDGTFASANCPYLHMCNWVGCGNRKKCKGAKWHRDNPGKGILRTKG